MDVRAEGPYEVGSLVFLSSEGAWVFTVIAKVTFALAPEESKVVAAGDPVLTVDVPWGEGVGWSLRASTDRVPFKQTAEVLLSGSAYSAGGKPVRAAMARLAFGTVDKTIEVQGDRYFGPGGVLSEAAPWTRMPLVWERAAGGAETINPVGIPTGRGSVTDARGRTYLPNLWPPWTSVAGPDDAIAPVCFGPLSPDWPDRLSRLPSALAWERPLPADFDGAYFNVAPEDQRLSEITGAETLVLEHLHPRHARLVTRLADATPIATVEAPGEAPVTIELAADTLWIDSDRGIATLTYRGHAAVQDPNMAGTFLVRARDRAPRAPSLPSSPPAPALPVSPPPALALPVSPPPAPSASDSPPLTRPAHRRQVTLEVMMPSNPLPPAWEQTGRHAAVPATPNLAQTPFVAPPPPAPPPPPTTGTFPATGTLPPTTGAFPATGTLPPTTGAFPALTGTGRHAAVAAPVPSATGTLPDPTGTVLVPPSAPVPGIALEETHQDAPAPAPATLAQALHAKRMEPLGSVPVERPREVAFVPPPTAPSEIVAPPLWSGDEETDERAPDTSRTPPLPEAPALVAPPPVPAGPPPLPIEEISLVRCAAIAATIDLRPDDETAILDEAKLDDELWARLREHWDSAVDKELKRHKNKLLRDQDAAYVAKIEEARGPIAASDYARLAAADEVNEIAPVLADLKIPAAAWPRIRRVWIQLLAKDRKLAALVQSFLEDERSR